MGVFTHLESLYSVVKGKLYFMFKEPCFKRKKFSEYCYFIKNIIAEKLLFHLFNYDPSVIKIIHQMYCLEQII